MRSLPLALALGLTACGDKDLNCGPGTVERDGQCVLVEDTGHEPDPPADADDDGYTEDDDCDDSDAAIHPGAAEVCDGVDNDCDGLVDDEDEDPIGAVVWYADTDGDGYGDAAVAITACDAGSGWVADNTDCDDGAAGVNPGASEVCDPDDVDEDCDGLVDDEDEGVPNMTAWYPDEDGDGYGAELGSVAACDAPSGRVADRTDCDDDDGGVNPGATEVCDGMDNDCDGLVDDEDGILADAPTWYADADGDGYGDDTSTRQACTHPSGYGARGGDCDDSDAAVNPGATEVCDVDDTDEDCDGLVDGADPDATGTLTWYADSDGDGYGDAASTTAACDQPSGFVAGATDCDDTDASVTGASTWYRDADGDGYGDAGSTTSACTAPSGYGADASDCDDTDGGVHPGATEVCDGADDDCDGLSDDDDPGVDLGTATEWCGDSDGDGYYGDLSTTWACALPAGYVDCGTVDDCDDSDAAVNPGAAEVCGNGVDDDCDGSGYPCSLTGSIAEADYSTVFLGANAGDAAGASVDLSDLDLDGNLDVVVGAPSYGSTGAVHLIYGPFSSSEDLAAADLTFTPRVGGDAYGQRVVARSDLNGDGYPEILVADPDFDSSYYTNGGAVHFITGGATPSDPGLYLQGYSGEHCGSELLGGLDLTGDGDGDLVVDCGVYGSYVYGLAELPTRTGSVFSSFDAFAYYDLGSGAPFAEDLAGGDLNGDGRQDLVILDPDSAGLTLWYIAGPHSSSGYISWNYDDSASYGSSFSSAVGEAGFDLDGDGYEDLAVSEASAGVTDIFQGDRTGTPLSSGAAISLAVAPEAMTWGDLDGDGQDDLALGDPSGSGTVYLFYGPLAAGSYAATDAGGTITGDLDALGVSLISGDVDSDGCDDLLIGAEDDDSAGSGAGAVFLFYGGSW